MTYHEFITALELYYGKYNKFIKAELTKYLFRNFNEKDLEQLKNLIFMNYSSKWKTPPDIAIIQEIVEIENSKFGLKELHIGIGNAEAKKQIENNLKLLK